MAFVLSLNLHRRHLDSSQRAMAAANAEPFLEAEREAARQRMAEGSKRGGGDRKSEKAKAERENRGQEIFPDPDPGTGQSRDRVAEAFGTNPRYVTDAIRIKAEAPELAEKVARGELTIPQAKKQLPKKAGAPAGGRAGRGADRPPCDGWERRRRVCVGCGGVGRAHRCALGNPCRGCGRRGPR